MDPPSAARARLEAGAQGLMAGSPIKRARRTEAAREAERRARKEWHNKFRTGNPAAYSGRLKPAARNSTDPEKLYVFLRFSYPADEPDLWLEQTLWQMAQTQSLMRLAYNAMAGFKFGTPERKECFSEYKEHRKHFHDLEKSVRDTTSIASRRNEKVSAKELKGERAASSMEGTELGEVMSELGALRGKEGG